MKPSFVASRSSGSSTMGFRKTAVMLSLFVALVMSSSSFYYNSLSYRYFLDYFEYSHNQQPELASRGKKKKKKQSLIIPDGAALLRQKYAQWNIPFLSAKEIRQKERQQPPPGTKTNKERRGFISISLNRDQLVNAQSASQEQFMNRFEQRMTEKLAKQQPLDIHQLASPRPRSSALSPERRAEMDKKMKEMEDEHKKRKAELEKEEETVQQPSLTTGAATGNRPSALSAQRKAELDQKMRDMEEDHKRRKERSERRKMQRSKLRRAAGANNKNKNNGNEQQRGTQTTTTVETTKQKVSSMLQDRVTDQVVAATTKRERSNVEKRRREREERRKRERSAKKGGKKGTKKKLRRANQDDNENAITTNEDARNDDNSNNSRNNHLANLQDPFPHLATSQARAFYSHHYQQMKTLLNESSALVWGLPGQARDFGALLQEFEPLLYQVPEELKQNADPAIFLQPLPYIYCDNICKMAKAFRKYQRHVKAARDASGTQQKNQYTNSNNKNAIMDHIVILGLNENIGSFSQEIANKTIDWMSDLEGDWERMGCTKQFIVDSYLNNPHVKAVITTQSQQINHPKVHSLPLGMVSVDPEWKDLMRDFLQHSPPESGRPQLLMINSSPTKTRSPVYERVIRNFQKEGVTVRNTFADYHFDDYRRELRKSKFILSPAGMGLDCYRHWEALYMGTIPVIEHLNRLETDGWFRVLEELPVALIDSYDNLTPQWLEEEYRRIVSRSYQYERLTKDYWIQLYKSSLVVDEVSL